MLLTLVILLAKAILGMAQLDYCKLCADHVACNSTGKFPPNCQDATLIRFKKCWIMRKHNEWRNEVAGGKVQNLKPACRMAYLQWDDELAVLALRNVVQCKVSHDKCVRSNRFPRVAQNLGTTNYDGNVSNIKNTIQYIVANWYKEVKNVRQSDININNLSNKTAQFTIMMADRTTRVGCAAATFKVDKKQLFLLTCNYGTTNIIGRPVYDVCDKPGKMCHLNSVQYNNLCGRDEELIKMFSKRKLTRIRYNVGIGSAIASTTYGSTYGADFNLGFNYQGYNPAYNYPVSNYAAYNYPMYPAHNYAVYPNYYIPPYSDYYPQNYAYVPGYGSSNGPINSYNWNDRQKNNNNDNVLNTNNDNTDNSSKGRRILNFTDSEVRGYIDMRNKNGAIYQTDTAENEINNKDKKPRVIEENASSIEESTNITERTTSTPEKSTDITKRTTTSPVERTTTPSGTKDKTTAATHNTITTQERTKIIEEPASTPQGTAYEVTSNPENTTLIPEMSTTYSGTTEKITTTVDKTITTQKNKGVPENTTGTQHKTSTAIDIEKTTSYSKNTTINPVKTTHIAKQKTNTPKKTTVNTHKTFPTKQMNTKIPKNTKKIPHRTSTTTITPVKIPVTTEESIPTQRVPSFGLRLL